MDNQTPPTQEDLANERQALLQWLQDWLEVPMVVLAFIWLALLVVEVVWGLGPLLEAVGYIVWGLFILEFILGFTLAPGKLDYLQRNWLKGIALLAPAMRIFRIINLLRVTRGLRLLRVISSTNRGMRALSASMSRRGFGYVVVLTLIVTVVGAAGMYSFERDNPDGRSIDSYGMALWWTAMIMTTMGSEFWPQTPEGRMLCFCLALYSFAMFGYVTATLATFFIGRDAAHEEAEVAGAKSIAALRAEIAALRDEIRALDK